MSYVYVGVVAFLLGAGISGYLCYKYGRMVEEEFQAGIKKLG